MLTHDGKAGVDIDKRLASGLAPVGSLRQRYVGVTGENSTDKVAYQCLALLTTWRLKHRRLKGLSVPRALKVTPFAFYVASMIEPGKKGFITIVLTLGTSILKQAL